LRHLTDLEPVESLGHIGDPAEMLRPRDLSTFGIHNETGERVLSEKEQTPQPQPEDIDFAAKSEVEMPATEKQQLSAEIRTLSKEATEEIDRMEQAGTRLTLLEQIRHHAETMVYERADREIRLQAEIEALRRTEAAQLERIKQAEAEAQTRQRAAEEALELAKEAVRRLAEEEEQRIEHLETIHRKAEASSQERAEKERLLNSQLLAFGEAAAEQVKRIKRMEADLREAAKKSLQLDEDVRQKSEHEAIRLTETAAGRESPEEQFRSAEAQGETKVREEQQPIGQSELIRGAAEKQPQQSSEIGPDVDIEAPGKSEIKQSQRIEEAETQLHHVRSEGRQAGVVGEIGTEENQQRTQLVADRNDDTQRLANKFPIPTSNAETPAAWWVSQFSNHADRGAEKQVHLASNDEFQSPVADVFKTSDQTSTKDADKPLEPVRSKGSIELTSPQTSIISSLAERIRTGDPAERADALSQVAQLDPDEAFSLITSLFDDRSAEVKNAAARALYELKPNRTDTFTRALREASPELRGQITKALVGSGLAAEAIDNLVSENQEETYDAFSMLCLMAKAGEFQSILHTIEMHPSSAVKLSVIKLLTFCNLPEIIPAFRNLAVRGLLPIEIRSALLASIYALKTKARENSPSAA
jgi:hypothetical protein